MNYLGTILSCVAVSLLWGGTNPFIKSATTGIAKVTANSYLKQFVNELTYLILNWKYILPFCLNQLGSVVYFLALQNAPLSLVVPLTNALTFVVTGLVGFVLGEEKPKFRSALGFVLIVLGTLLCVLDKVGY